MVDTPLVFSVPAVNSLGRPEVAAISESQHVASMQVTSSLSSVLQAASLSRLQARSSLEHDSCDSLHDSLVTAYLELTPAS